MTEVKSKKPLLEAIQNGEQNIKVTDPKFLLACLVAEECDNDKSNVKKFPDVILGSKTWLTCKTDPKSGWGWSMKRGKFGGCSSIFRYFQRLLASSTS